MPVAQPKYAEIVDAITARIEDGTYQPGAAIPSEPNLMAEFHTSRPTVVRALQILKQDGWIGSEHGKGRFVNSRSAIASRQSSNHLNALINQEEAASVALLYVGPVLASARIADALKLDEGTPVIGRQRLVKSDIGPIELGYSYVPVELAHGAGIGDRDPITEGILRRLTARKNVHFSHGVERIGARRPSKDEAELLEINTRECVLTILMTALDRQGAPLAAVDVLIPTSRHELEDTFPIQP